MNLPRPSYRLAQLRRREIGALADVEDHLLATRHHVDGGGELLDRFGGNDDGTVIVGVDHLVMPHLHAEDIDGLGEIDEMDMRVAGADAAADHLEVLGPGGEVPEG